jgi:hypothetical protein
VLKSTPHPKRTPINVSQSPTLYCLEPFPRCRSAEAHGVMVLGAVSGTTSYMSPLPPCRVDNGFRSISGRLQSGFRVSSHSIHRGEHFKPIKPRRYATNPRGSDMGTKGVNSRHKIGRLWATRGRYP